MVWPELPFINEWRQESNPMEDTVVAGYERELKDSIQDLNMADS
jgi:hypothetical protein